MNIIALFLIIFRNICYGGIMNDILLFEEVNLDFPYIIQFFKKGEFLFHENDEIKKVGIILDGKASIITSTIDGFSFEFNTLNKGAIFGDALLFNHELLPGSIVALSEVKVMFIEDETFKNLMMKNHKFLFNYLKFNAKRNEDMQYKIKLFGQPSIKEKILFYIKEEMKKQKTNKIKTLMNREELSAFLSLSRPSLSRELMRMKKEGIIDYDRYTISYFPQNGS